MADRPKYTDAQLTEYFARIALPKRHRVPALYVKSMSDKEKLAYLTLLKQHHLVKVPFENLTQHYSWHRVINTKPQHLFKKIVHEPGRGGYCMEVNSFLHTVLLSLGFDVYLAGARVYEPVQEKYGVFSHCVNIVRIGDQKYLVDVGFGGTGPSRPVSLMPGLRHVNVAPAGMRLLHEPIPQNLSQDSKVWIYQHQNNADAGWTTVYCFVDFEFLLEDIQAMNWGPWRSPTSWFTQKVVVARFTSKAEVGSEGGAGCASEVATSPGEIDGLLSIDHDKLKWRRNGEKKLDVTLSNEDERVQALRKHFGIQLPNEDVEAIRGTVAEIKDGLHVAGLE